MNLTECWRNVILCALKRQNAIVRSLRVKLVKKSDNADVFYGYPLQILNKSVNLELKSNIFS